MKMNMSSIDLLMARAEQGLQHAHDAGVLFEALKSAAQQHTAEADILKFLLHHIGRGYESYYDKKRKQQHD